MGTATPSVPILDTEMTTSTPTAAILDSKTTTRTPSVGIWDSKMTTEADETGILVLKTSPYSAPISKAAAFAAVQITTLSMRFGFFTAARATLAILWRGF